MGRFLIFILALGGGYLLIDKVGVSPFGGPQVNGREVVVETKQLRVHFTKVGSFSDSFMVFGGHNQRMTNRVDDASMATLAMRHAELISLTYPDFHRCASPGAAQAQQLTETSNFIGASRAAKRALVKAVDLHGERVRSSGDRTCISVSGSQLVFDSLELKETGQDLTAEMGSPFEQGSYYLAERVELPSCEDLLN